MFILLWLWICIRFWYVFKNKLEFLNRFQIVGLSHKLVVCLSVCVCQSVCWSWLCVACWIVLVGFVLSFSVFTIIQPHYLPSILLLVYLIAQFVISILFEYNIIYSSHTTTTTCHPLHQNLSQIVNLNSSRSDCSHDHFCPLSIVTFYLPFASLTLFIHYHLTIVLFGSFLTQMWMKIFFNWRLFFSGALTH